MGFFAMNWSDASKTFENIKKLIEFGFNESLSTYLPEADSQVYEHLDNELEHVDFTRLEQHRAALKHHESRQLSLGALKPFRFQRQMLRQSLKLDVTSRGRRLLETGAVAEAILAGGAATRFFKGKNIMPKALYPITPVAGKSFLDLFLQEAAMVTAVYGTAPPVLIMVSRVTRDRLTKHIREHHLFGLPRDCVFVFPQAHHPRLDNNGNLIIKPDGGLVWYGDGHGGIYGALLRTGLRARLMSAGVRTVVLHNVDNPLSRPFDTKRLGIHDARGRVFTLTVYQRTRPEQKVGILAKVLETGAIEVIEYSEAAPEVMEAVDDKGLVFDCGHVNTNCFDLSVVRDDVPPALYRNKPLVVGDRETRSSTFEILNQHLTRLLPGHKVGIFAGPQEEYFLPTKNMTGPDSVETTQRFLSDRGMEALRHGGATIHGRGQTADISPVMDADGIRRMFKRLEIFDRARVYLSPVEGKGFHGKVVVKKEGTLIVDSMEPFGTFQAGPNRKATQVPPPPMVDVSGSVEVGKGATLILRLNAGAVLKIDKNLKIPDGKSVEITVSQGETRNSWRS